MGVYVQRPNGELSSPEIGEEKEFWEGASGSEEQPGWFETFYKSNKLNTGLGAWWAYRKDEPNFSPAPDFNAAEQIDEELFEQEVSNDRVMEYLLGSSSSEQLNYRQKLIARQRSDRALSSQGPTSAVIAGAISDPMLMIPLIATLGTGILGTAAGVATRAGAVTSRLHKVARASKIGLAATNAAARRVSLSVPTQVSLIASTEAITHSSVVTREVKETGVNILLGAALTAGIGAMIGSSTGAYSASATSKLTGKTGRPATAFDESVFSSMRPEIKGRYIGGKLDDEAKYVKAPAPSGSSVVYAEVQLPNGDSYYKALIGKSTEELLGQIDPKLKLFSRYDELAETYTGASVRGYAKSQKKLDQSITLTSKALNSKGGKELQAAFNKTSGQADGEDTILDAFLGQGEKFKPKGVVFHGGKELADRGKLLSGFAKMTLMGPMRLLTSDNPSMVSLMRRMVTSPLVHKSNKGGRASPISIESRNISHGEQVQNTMQHLKKLVHKTARTERVKANDLYDNMGRYMLTGVEPIGMTKGTKAIAEWMSKHYWQPWLKKWQSIGKLEGVATDKLYLPLIPKRDVIRGEADAFKSALRLNLKSQNKGMADNDLDELVESYYGHYTNSQSAGSALQSRPALSSNLKHRELQVDEDLVDFFITNPVELAENYAFKNIPQFQWLKHMGDIDLEPHLAKIRAEAKSLSQSLAAPKRAKYLEKSENEVKALRAYYNHMFGLHRRDSLLYPSQTSQLALQIVRSATAIFLLPGILLASLPDLGAHIMRNGASALSRPLTRIGDALTGRPSQALGKSEVSILLSDNQNALDSILQMLTNGEAWGNVTSNKAMRGVIGITDKFFKWTGANAWNHIGKMKASSDAFRSWSNAAENLVEGRKISSSELTNMAKDGLGTEELRTLYANLKKYGSKEKIGWRANFDLWDGDARSFLDDTLDPALRQLARTTIIEPAPSSIPLLAQNPIGATITTIMRFFWAANANYLMPILQQAGMNPRHAAGVAAMISVGMGSHAVKRWSKGEKILKRGEDMNHLLFYSWQRTGLTTPLWPLLSSAIGMYGFNAPFYSIPSEVQQSISRYNDGETVEDILTDGWSNWAGRHPVGIVARGLNNQ